MKSLLKLFFIPLFAIAIAAQHGLAAEKTNTQGARGDLFVASTGLNLRKAPGIQSPIIRRAEANEVVMLDSADEKDGFVQVRLKDGNPAWVSKKYLKKITDL